MRLELSPELHWFLDVANELSGSARADHHDESISKHPPQDALIHVYRLYLE
jgi:hypothetical protein